MVAPCDGRRVAPSVPSVELGRLVQVAPREVWANEARDFTPWLLANSDHLAEALGIDLELRAAEHPVGGYTLDLLGHDLTNDAVLMVENQLESTDHGHLGQLLTYAAGTGAATIVWIATAFRDEHRQALDWLNEHTAEEVHFFGVQLTVVRIGDSAPAPNLEVVAKPNDWQKVVRNAARSGSVSPRGEQYKAFWALFLERMARDHPSWGRRSTPQAGNWMAFVGPFPGTQITPSFAAGRRLRHELYIDGGDAAGNQRLFDLLLQRRTAIEGAYGRSLEFDSLDGRRACRVADYLDDADVQTQERWPEYLDWFFDAGQRLRSALASVEKEVRASVSSTVTTPLLASDPDPVGAGVEAPIS